MTVSNVWAIRRSFGISESMQNVRRLIIDQFVRELKEKYEQEENEKDLDNRNYVPVHCRKWSNLNKTRLEKHGHYPTKLKGVYRVCVYHRYGVKTNSFCRKCKVHIHVGKCFEKWHSEENVRV